MKRVRIIFILIVALALILGLLFGLSIISLNFGLEDPPIDIIESESEPEPEPEPEKPRYVTLIAVGDHMMHGPVVRNGLQADGSYDFSSMYAMVKPRIAAADIAFVNQEAPLSPDHPPSGYPLFNAPQDIGRALAEVGFDVINQANNHALDKGPKAVMATADFWDTIPTASMIGMNRSTEEAQNILVIEREGVRFAFLAYTYGINGMPMTEPYMVPLIDSAKMAADIEHARAISDILIVSIHWGHEYWLNPSDEQKSLAQLMANNGVDLGGRRLLKKTKHCEWVTSEDGSRRTFVAYSLGNFVSSMHERETQLEGMLSINFRIFEGKVSIDDAGVIPLVNHYDRSLKDFRIYYLKDYDDELAANHGVRAYTSGVSMQFFEDLSKKVLGDFLIYE
jgi:poly-gamma-glutamate synthesis protein (capsule biosynthesis protein)